jgi:hypothetical protein
MHTKFLLENSEGKRPSCRRKRSKFIIEIVYDNVDCIHLHQNRTSGI